MENQVGHMPRGQSVTQIPDAVLGVRKVFTDVNWGSTEAIKPRLTGADVHCRLVQNTSAGALLPGQAVVWKTGFFLTQIGATAGSLSLAAGIVDEYLPAAGVPINSYFWLVVEGPTLVINDGVGVLAEGAILVCSATAGQVLAQTAAPGQGSELAQVNGVIGFTLASITNVAATKGRAVVKLAAR
jgi:hypothetical protein